MSQLKKPLYLNLSGSYLNISLFAGVLLLFKNLISRHALALGVVVKILFGDLEAQRKESPKRLQRKTRSNAQILRLRLA